MEIVYLDQNKWIELARVHAGVTTSGPIVQLYPQLVAAVESERVIFPLSVSHVIETSKRNDPLSRGTLAETQAKLSRGFAFRSRAGRLLVEVRDTLHRIFGLVVPEKPANWFIAPGFLQAFETMDELLASPSELQRLVLINSHIDPSDQYLDFMKNQDDERRRSGHALLSAKANDLVTRIEARRARLAHESIDIRCRVYAAELFSKNQEMFIRVLNSMGYSVDQLRAMGDKAARALVDDVPTLDVEAQMAARLESENGQIRSNDLYDMQSFYTAVPYSGRIVAEKAAVSRARQAKLEAKYRVILSTSLDDLLDVY